MSRNWLTVASEVSTPLADGRGLSGGALLAGEASEGGERSGAASTATARAASFASFARRASALSSAPGLGRSSSSDQTSWSSISITSPAIAFAVSPRFPVLTLRGAAAVAATTVGLASGGGDGGRGGPPSFGELSCGESLPSTSLKLSLSPPPLASRAAAPAASFRAAAPAASLPLDGSSASVSPNMAEMSAAGAIGVGWRSPGSVRESAVVPLRSEGAAEVAWMVSSTSSSMSAETSSSAVFPRPQGPPAAQASAPAAPLSSLPRRLASDTEVRSSSLARGSSRPRPRPVSAQLDSSPKLRELSHSSAWSPFVPPSPTSTSSTNSTLSLEVDVAPCEPP